jgi:hypothetical protein
VAQSDALLGGAGRHGAAPPRDSFEPTALRPLSGPLSARQEYNRHPSPAPLDVADFTDDAPEAHGSNPESPAANQAGPPGHRDAHWPTPLMRLAGPRYLAAEDSKHDGGLQRLSDDEQSRWAALLASGHTRPWARDPPAATPGTAQDRPFLAKHDEQVAAASDRLQANFSMQTLYSWMQDAALSDENASSLLSILTHDDFEIDGLKHIKSIPQFKRLAGSAMPDLIGATCVPIIIPDAFGNDATLTLANGQPATLNFLNVWEQALLMYRDPEFAAKTVIFPQPQYKVPGDPKSPRVYSNFASGLLFESMQQTVESGTGVAAVALYSDESSLLSNQDAYPVYCESLDRTSDRVFACCLLHGTDCCCWRPPQALSSTAARRKGSSHARGNAWRTCTLPNTSPTTSVGQSSRVWTLLL